MTHLGSMNAEGAPIVILTSVNRDGATFALDPRSVARIRSKFGSSVHVRPRVFIAHGSRTDDESISGSIVPQVVSLLTGIPMERLETLGRVTFRDPVTDLDLPVATPG